MTLALLGRPDDQGNEPTTVVELHPDIADELAVDLDPLRGYDKEGFSSSSVTVISPEYVAHRRHPSRPGGPSAHRLFMFGPEPAHRFGDLFGGGVAVVGGQCRLRVGHRG